jgi:hypothetical protein
MGTEHRPIADGREAPSAIMPRATMDEATSEPRPMIGSWYCLPERELSAAALAAYAAAGFSHFQTLDRASVGWRPYSVEGNRRALDLCAAAGLRCHVVDARLYRGQRPYPPETAPGQAEVDAVVADYGRHPALAGYLLYDEPSPHAFPALADTIARLRARDPSASALVPLFPMHADPRFPNAFEGRDYPTYLREFVRTCRPPALAYDYYPFFDPPARWPEYLANFRIAADVAREAGLPLWYYPAIVAGPPARLAPTLGRIRLQVNLALAHGASALLHFTYRSDARAPREVVRTANREAAALLAAIGGRWPTAVDHGAAPETTVALFEAPRQALVVNRDPQVGRPIAVVVAGQPLELELPPGGGALLPL